MSFATMTAQLNLNIQNFKTSLNQAKSDLNKFGSSMAGYGKKVGTNWEDVGKRIKESTVEVKRHSLGLKDTARIVQGIMISQAFYGIAQTIRSATSALWDFNKELDYSQVTYAALFGSADISTDFLSYLRDYAEDTIFTFEDLTNSAKKLLAYGLPYENIGYIMSGLTSLGTISGDTAALDRIALALGQIYTKGKLSAEEMRQLANAYVPITEIITQRFGLSEEQLKSVGDLNLPAEDVINAIVDYANQTYGASADAAMLTIKGLESKIAEVMKNIGSDMLKPITALYKSFLAHIADGLEGVRNAFESGGIGGLFEHLVPDPKLQQVIRQFLANVQNMFSSLSILFSALKAVFGDFIVLLMQTFSIVAPVITPVINVFATLLHVISQSTTGMAVLRVALLGAAAAFVVLRMQAAYATILSVVTKVVDGLSKSLILLGGIITRHPVLAGIAALGLALLALSASSKAANNGISGLFDKLSGVNGKTSDDVLQKTSNELEDNAAKAQQFNNKLGDGKEAADALNDAINGTGKAAKKAAGLLAFDEVFKLNEKSDDGTGGILDSIDALMEGIGDFGSGLLDGLLPEIGDFSEWTDQFTKGLFGDLLDSVKRIAVGAAAGGLIGGLVGFAIGGMITRTMAGALTGAKWGAKIGTIAGAGFGAFWDDVSEEMQKSINGIVQGGAEGLLLGGITGFILGALTTRSLKGALTGAKYGAAIGAFAGGAIGGVFNTLSEKVQHEIESIAWGGAEGMLLGGLAGFIIGAFATRTLAGATTGAKWGVGLGAAIGASVTKVFGEAEETVKERVQNIGNSVSAASTGALIGGLAGMVIGAIVGAFAGGIGALPGAKAGAMIGSALGSLGGMLVEYLKTSGVTEALSEFFTDMWNKVGETFAIIEAWFDDLYDTISTWWEETKLGFSNWWHETRTGFTTWLNTTKSGFINWWTTTKSGLSTWWSETKSGFTNWWSETKSGFAGWVAETIRGFINWVTGSGGTLSQWWATTKQGFSDWRSNTLSGLSTWWANTKRSFSDWVSNVNNKLGEFFGLDVSFSTFCSNTFRKISDWAANVWETIRDKFNKAISKIMEFLNLSSEASNTPAPSTKTSSAPKTQSSSTQTTRTPVSSGNGWVSYGVGRVSTAHATGGIFNREHIARFAEGNKAEAIIPLENDRAMQPFVNAVSQGIIEGLAPTLLQVGSGNNNSLPPMYVGTLVADERGLKQLYKKFELIQVQENARKGLAT